MSLAFTVSPLSDARFCVTGLHSEDVTKFNYDATEPRGKRKTAKQYSTAEDYILDPSRRARLTANGRDLARNFSIASWMIRRHLDYVASFEFHCRTGIVEFDAQVETFMEEFALNCDRRGAHILDRMIRIAEIRRVIDGDVGFYKLANGQLQGVESDRIKNPQGESSGEWVQGVQLDRGGRAKKYAIWARNKTGLVFDRTIPAEHLEMIGYYDRFDQTRGVSPLSSALNPLRDVYEGFDLALAKMKVQQLFAMIFTTKALDAAGDTTRTTDEEGRNRYEVDFGLGPIKLELDEGEDAKFLTDQHPSSQFQSFTELIIQVALKALDIPFSFYNESFTNFFGSRAAWLHYQRSCKPKQADLRRLLDALTRWRLMLAILDDQLSLPAGMTLSDLKWEWVATGMPWWDPAKEINGDLLAIAAGLDNPQRIVKERGRGDWYDNVDRIAEAISYAQKAGVPLSFLPQSIQLNVTENADQ